LGSVDAAAAVRNWADAPAKSLANSRSLPFSLAAAAAASSVPCAQVSVAESASTALVNPATNEAAIGDLNEPEIDDSRFALVATVAAMMVAMILP
jgi:hypothetical protein